MTTAWFHCFSGIAGDMALGALVDAGADIDEVTRLLERLPVGGWEVEAEPVLRGGIAGTKVHVRYRETSVVRTAAHIQGLIAEARLPDRVQERALAVFSALAIAEGRLHRRPPDQVHFHEVGGIDAIVDVVGTCAALEILDVDTVSSSPVAVGLGMVRAAHGIIPNPAPAVVELLRGAPTYGVDLALELTTPTGAAIVAALATFGPMPPMTVGASGFGAGNRELPDRPNLTQVVVGDALPQAAAGGQPQVLLEANLDDTTGEVLANAVAALLEAGAADAWIVPVIGKKGRPAHVLSALCDVALLDQVRAVFVSESGTLGLRGTSVDRWPSPRSMEVVDVDGLPVRVKVSPGRAKAEFDDAAGVARRSRRPVRDVIAEAEARWQVEQPAEPVDPGGSTGPVGLVGDADAPSEGHDHEHHHGHSHEHDDVPTGRPWAPSPEDLPPA